MREYYTVRMREKHILITAIDKIFYVEDAF